MELTKVKAIMVLIIIFSISLASYYVYSTYFVESEVVIGYLEADLHHLALFVALEKGWFEEEGLKISTRVYQNGMAEMDGFKAGEIDIGYLGIAPALIKRINAGINITVVAAVNVNGSAIIVGKNSQVDSLEDLAGKNIAIPGYGTVQHFLLLLALEKAGLSEEKVNITRGFGPSNMELMLSSGQIDGFIAWEPFCADAVVRGIGVYLVKSGELWRNHPCCVVAVRSDFLEKHRDIVFKILSIHVKATKWIQEHFEEAVKIAVKHTGFSEETVRLALENIAYVYNPDLEGIRIYLEKLIEKEIISVNEGFNVSRFLTEFIDLSILEAVENVTQFT
ncbi:MAG: ABC transporter substrate-binding protein [Candidatus Baldrarchaeia archaeon]